MRYLRKLYKELKSYVHADHLALIECAYQQAARAHQHQRRHSGEPYITHPTAVAVILAKMRLDYQTIIAALLHDVLEDTDMSKAEIIEHFGEEVAELVDGVSKLTQIEFETRAHAQAENFRKMILAMAKDIRVILVKLADRLHNMRTLGALPRHKLRRICDETLEIYAPIANRLGMHAFRVEYEELAFAALYPRRYEILKRAVKKAKGNQKEMVQRVQRAMTKQLNAWGLTKVMLFGREKQVYSIYHKMRSKHLSFAEIMDIYGFRVIVDRVEDCYRALGALHNLYKPIPGRFKDYIASSKSNGYQSLHTTLFGPYGVPLEIQFRTQDMHHTADNGIAAHWLYKSKESYVNDAHQRAKQWVERLLELQQGAGNSLEFIEHVKIDLFPNEVYVFTPKGAIFELPAKSTPIDFAYAVHSAVGNTCVAAKVDKRLVPLHTVLKNGQTIEIITAPSARPHTFWLQVVKTGKAKSAIRHFFKSQHRSEAASLGKQLLEQAIKQAMLQSGAFPEKSFSSMAAHLGLQNEQELFEEIGLGSRMASLVVEQWLNVSSDDVLQKPFVIQGTEGVLLHYAACCQPIVGDDIIGIVQPGQGIEVHRVHCVELTALRMAPGDRQLVLSWQPEVQLVLPVTIFVDAEDKVGLLAKITAVLDKQQVFIKQVELTENGSVYCRVMLVILVKHRQHLEDILHRLVRVEGVLHACRAVEME